MGPLDCVICLEGAQQGGRHAVVTRCGHVFCAGCAEAWFQGESTCPVCRGEVDVGRDLITVYSQGRAGPRTSVSKHPSAAPDSALEGLGASLEGGPATADGAPLFPVKQILEKVSGRWNRLVLERAKHLQTIASLNEEVVALEEQLQIALKENRELKAQQRSEVPGPAPAAAGGVGGGAAGGEGVPGAGAGGAVAAGAAAGLRDREEALWRGSDWVEALTFTTHAQQVQGIAVHRTEPLVATASWDETCQLYDLERMCVATTLRGHQGGLYAVEFSPLQPRLLGTASSDQTARIWDKQTGACRRVLQGHTGEVNGIAFHERDRRLATASDDATVRLWDYERPEAVAVLRSHEDSVYGVCFEPKGGALACSVSFDRTAKLWDLRAPHDAPRHTLCGHSAEAIGISCSPCGRFLATGSDDGTCLVWDFRTLAVLATLEHECEVKRVKFSPCGSLLAATLEGSCAALHAVVDWECVKVLRGHQDCVFDCAWAPDGGSLATASHDCQWRMWRPRRYAEGGSAERAGAGGRQAPPGRGE